MVAILIGMIFLIGSGLRLFQIWRDWQDRRGWGIASGTVTRAELKRVSPRDEPDSIAQFEPNIIYTYTVNGKHYRGEIGDDNIGLVNQARGKQLMTQYAEGQPLEVYYHPVEPWHSRLFSSPATQPRQIFYAGVGLVAGIILLIIGLV